MAVDIIALLEDHNIEITTEGKNCHDGWVNVHCPFCDDPSNHGGFHLYDNIYNCWKCGWHPFHTVLSLLLDIKINEAIRLSKEYETNRIRIPKAKKIKRRTEIILPYGTEIMAHRHRKYLIKRNYDPDYLEQEYGLLGTGHLDLFKFRIIIPVILKNKIVSYQGRDITGKSMFKYITCAPEEEVIFHKSIVYNSDRLTDKAVVVEGVTDVWRLGPGSVASFGTNMTDEQILFLKNKNVKRVFMLFDFKETAAQMIALKNGIRFASLGIDVEQIELDQTGDPGDMSEDDAKYLMRELIKK